MEQVTMIFSDFPIFQLHALLAGVLLFAMLGVRSLVDEQINGYLYLSLSFIFLFFHWFLLLNMPLDSWPINNVNLVGWLSKILAPTLILVILSIGLYDLLSGRALVAAFKLFLGFSLMGILFNLGKGWSTGIQITLVLLWIALWFRVEMRTAQ